LSVTVTALQQLNTTTTSFIDFWLMVKHGESSILDSVTGNGGHHIIEEPSVKVPDGLKWVAL